MRIGIREFKQKASYILRQVRENKEEFIITYRGRSVARLIPIIEEKRANFC